MLFFDRQDAGSKLAKELLAFQGNPEVILLGLPRGGVIVAKEISRQLHLALDVIIARKLGAPYNSELGIGAICEEEIYLNEPLIHSLNIQDIYIQQEIQKQRMEAKRREALYRKGKPPLVLKGKTALLIDDGIATGATMFAAVLACKKRAERTFVAVPFSPPETKEKLLEKADGFFCIFEPANLMAVGQFYEHFEQTTDEEVIQALQ